MGDRKIKYHYVLSRLSLERALSRERSSHPSPLQEPKKLSNDGGQKLGYNNTHNFSCMS
jgi:hypothetical protein